MNSSLKDEVIHLTVRCEHEDLGTTHTRSHRTNGGNTKSAAFPRNHRHFNHNYFVIIIVPVLSLENFLFSFFLFLRQSACACFQALQFVTIRTVF